MPNHLIDSTSPYLLQHAHNPVEWYPWGPEALERARREERPIFLSIGYAACHWCHVMEHESFENPATAAVMNRLFINIKVDREERPDLDDLYMLATQLMTGQGGWPMSVWLTPELEPFYAGTYFPPADGYGRPGFPRLLEALADAWKNRRGDLMDQSQRVVEAIRMHADESAGNAGTAASVSAGDAGVDHRDAWIRLAIEQFSDRFDAVNGGFGSAPKFPPHQTLQLWAALLDGTHESVAGVAGADEQVIAEQLARTLDGMKNGGIYDHVGGGFARYSTDDKWLVPHFEKMLYDSAQLAPVYARASLVLQNPEYARVARHTLEFFLREMRAEGGAFYSSLDADSEGEEGKYYVWTPDDVRQALPEGQDAEIILAHLGTTPGGNWHESPVDGGSVLAIAASVESLSQQSEATPAAMRARIDALLEMMRQVRARRVPPGLDDKILTSWNGLMLSALAETGRLLAVPELLEAGVQLADYLLTHHVKEGQLLRVSRGGGRAHTPGFLDDHAFLLNGLIDLMDALPDRAAQWRPAAIQLADALLRDFQDHAHGGFFFTGPQHEKLFCRMKNAADNATPSANGVAIRALMRLSKQTGTTQYAQAARRAVSAFQTAIARRPEYFPTILLALLESASTQAEAAAETLGTPTPTEDQPGLKLEAAAVPATPVGGAFELTLRLLIPPEYHIQPATGPNATIVRLRALGEPILRDSRWEFPEPVQVEGTMGYQGTIELRASCALVATATPGPHLLRASCTAQRCTSSTCLLPETVHLDIPIEILVS